MVEIKDLSLIIKRNCVLDGISLTASKGRITGFVGPNGSGKTITMKCMAGFITTYTGSISINGINTRDIKVPGMGILIETPGFISYYSGFRNLKILAGLSGIRDDKMIKDIMIEVGLDPRSSKPVSKYSLGMKQRLGIAQAFMEDKDIIILDEPFNGLDSEISEVLRKRILKEKDLGKTIIISSHNKQDIDTLCDKVYLFECGRIAGVQTRE